MKARIEYLHKEEFLDSFEIEDIGNVALVMYNDQGYEWYLSVTTSLGWSKVYSFGPLLPDINSLVIKSFSFNYAEVEYKENKLYNIVSKFIQDPRKEITQIIETNKEHVLERYNSLSIGE